MFAVSPHLAGVKELNFSDNDIADVGALALADAPTLDGLELLDLSSNRVSRTGIRALRGRFGDRVRLGRQKWLPRWLKP